MFILLVSLFVTSVSSCRGVVLFVYGSFTSTLGGHNYRISKWLSRTPKCLPLHSMAACCLAQFFAYAAARVLNNVSDAHLEGSKDVVFFGGSEIVRLKCVAGEEVVYVVKDNNDRCMKKERC
jgi:hypothetical protein